MLDPAGARAMARCNAWRNGLVVAWAEGLAPAARRADRGLFWGSVEGALAHLFWADEIWMSRFAERAAPTAALADSAGAIADWPAWRAARADFDVEIRAWADGLEASALARPLTWRSIAAQRDVSAPLGRLVQHVFNHQTRHRGQLHALATQDGGRGWISDLFLTPDDA